MIMTGKIELAIEPGKGLGPFKLGSSLWDLLLFFSKKKNIFPKVELKYSEQEPLLYDFIVALPLNGLFLRFDGSLQRLKSVECQDLSKVKLVYQGNDVSSSKAVPTFLLLYNSFGPTYPGEFDADQSIYTLKYPGLAFMFQIPTRYQEIYKSFNDLPSELPDGTTPIASKVILYASNASEDIQWQQVPLPTIEPIIAEHNTNHSITYGKTGRRELESVTAKMIRKEIELYFPIQGNDQKNSHVSIQLHNTTAQDILADLGVPSHIFYKEQDKMKIHSLYKKPSQASVPKQQGSLESSSDYFFNYFHLGLDILIDGVLHVCKKVVLHTNVPGHCDFSRYKRCPFKLIFPSQDDHSDNSQIQYDKNDNNGNIKNKGEKVDIQSNDEEKDDTVMKNNGNNQNLQAKISKSENIVTRDMKIGEMQSLIPWKPNNISQSSPDEALKPVVLTRGSSEHNPFGPTYLTGYDQGVVMEVMNNGCVPTIVLY